MRFILIHTNTILWAVQIMKLVITQFSPAPRLLLPLKRTYLPPHLFSSTLSQCSSLNARPHFTPINSGFSHIISKIVLCFLLNFGSEHSPVPDCAKAASLHSCFKMTRNHAPGTLNCGRNVTFISGTGSCKIIHLFVAKIWYFIANNLMLQLGTLYWHSLSVCL